MSAGPLFGFWALAGTLFGVLLHGMALNFVPFAHLLIPITVALFAGRYGARRETLVGAGLSYAAGLAMGATALGATASLTGGHAGELAESALWLAPACVALLLMALRLFGFFGDAPRSATRLGYAGSLIAGVLVSVLALPRASAYVTDLHWWVETLASPWLASLVFGALTIGLVLPLVAMAVLMGRLCTLRLFEGWGPWGRKLAAWVLLVCVAGAARPVLPGLVATALPALVAAAAGIHLGGFARGATGALPPRWARGLAMALGVAWAAWWAFV